VTEVLSANVFLEIKLFNIRTSSNLDIAQIIQIKDTPLTSF
jgi:hypothetical protein